MNKEKTIKVAATQMSCSWELEDNLSKAKNIINEAAKKGANIIFIPSKKGQTSFESG